MFGVRGGNNANVKFQDSPNVDAFGRLRVSQVTTQLDIKQIHDKQPLLIDEELIGTGTATHFSTTSQTLLEVTANSDAAIMQTYQRFNYQSGKSQLLFWTFNGFDNEANTTKRVGYFSSNTTTPFNSTLDGLFLQSDGTDISVQVYRSGTQVSEVKRSDWNNPLDGSVDGVTHDFDKNTILCVYFEWLGAGRIRWCIVKQGAIIPFHYLDYTDDSSVYMTSPNQPMRWECRATGETGGTGFNYICASVSSEGAINQIGKVLSENSVDNDLQFNTAGTFYAGIGIRLKSTHFESPVDLIEFDYLAETNDRALWELRLNPTVTGTFAYTDVTNSACQTAVGNQTGGAAPTVTGGTVLASGYVEQNGGRRIQIDSAIKLGASIDGTQEEIVLCVMPIQNGLDAYVSYNWRELV